MSRPEYSYAGGERLSKPPSSGERPAATPPPRPTSGGRTGSLLTEGGSAPPGNASGPSSTGDTYWNQRIPQAGPSYGMTADSYLRWLKSRYTPKIATATTMGQAKDALFSDPMSYNLIVGAARQWYKGYSNFDPQWAEGFWSEDIVPAAQRMGVNPMFLLQQISSGALTRDNMDSARSGSGSYGRGGFGGGGGGSSTQMTIDITTPTGARALLTQAMQGILGRDPSDEEIAKFTTVLNESQQVNPQVVSAVGDTVTRTGGFEADVFAMDFVKDQEEYSQVQGTGYYRALIDALTGGGI
jgi:hypothetical protein